MLGLPYIIGGAVLIWLSVNKVKTTEEFVYFALGGVFMTGVFGVVTGLLQMF